MEAAENLVSWTDIFRSRYVRLLEAQLVEIKKTHAEELNRVMLEANRGWAEADRLRQYLIPGLATSTRFPETATDNVPHQEVEGGTPFQRIAKRVMEEDEKRYQAAEAARRAREAQPAAVPAQEKN